MKTFLLILTIILALLALSACNIVKSAPEPNLNTNLITETKITDREKMFLSIENNEYFIFDFNVDAKYKWVEIWVDGYELGKKTPSTGKMSTELYSGKDGLIIATVSEFDKMKQNWNLVISSGGSTSTSKITQEYKTSADSLFSKMWGTNTSKTIPINNNEIILANICYRDQSKSNTMSSLTDNFFRNPEENMKEIEIYDLVYLLKCKFYTNNPNQ